MDYLFICVYLRFMRGHCFVRFFLISVPGREVAMSLLLLSRFSSSYDNILKSYLSIRNIFTDYSDGIKADYQK